jgi:hypothetical protein
MAQYDNAPRRILLTNGFQVMLEGPGSGRRSLFVLLFHLCLPKEDRCECAEDNWSGILFYGEGFETLSSYNRPPTLVVRGEDCEVGSPFGTAQQNRASFERKNGATRVFGSGCWLPARTNGAARHAGECAE